MGRRASWGGRRRSVKPARYSAVQKRLLPLEKLCPAAAAVVAGLMPQNTTSRSSARTSGSYVAKAAPDLPAPRAWRPGDTDLWGRRPEMFRVAFFYLSVDRG